MVALSSPDSEQAQRFRTDQRLLAAFEEERLDSTKVVATIVAIAVELGVNPSDCIDFCAEIAERFGHTWDMVRYVIENQLQELLDLFIIANTRFEEALKLICDRAIETKGNVFVIGPMVRRATKEAPTRLRPFVTHKMVTFGQSLDTESITSAQVDQESIKQLYDHIYTAILDMVGVSGADLVLNQIVVPIRQNVEQILALFVQDAIQLQRETR